MPHVAYDTGPVGVLLAHPIGRLVHRSLGSDSAAVGHEVVVAHSLEHQEGRHDGARIRDEMWASGEGRSPALTNAQLDLLVGLPQGDSNAPAQDIEGALD